MLPSATSGQLDRQSPAGLSVPFQFGSLSHSSVRLRASSRACAASSSVVVRPKSHGVRTAVPTLDTLMGQAPPIRRSQSCSLLSTHVCTPLSSI